MSQPKRASHILKDAIRVASLPLSWPAEALRRTRASIGDRSRSAERAKFDTRKWTPHLLKHLEWRRFEEMCAAYFEALGYATHVAAARVGGGADIALSAAPAQAPSILVHCKAWDAYRVGVKPLRDLRAAMGAAGVREGILITAGRFTHDTASYAATENIRLIDGAALLASFDELPPDTVLALLKLATQGDFLTPTCPGCAIKMAARKSTQGGRQFWGCLNYPRCKETFSGTAPA